MEDRTADAPDENVVVMADTHFHSCFGNRGRPPGNCMSSKKARFPSGGCVDEGGAYFRQVKRRLSFFSGQ